MAILDRVSNILRANVNSMLDQAEDPEKMIDQIIRDMDSALQDGRAQVRDMIAQQKLIEGDQANAQKQANEWSQKAELAVSKSRDDLAIEALRRKKDYDAQMQIYQGQLDAQKQAVDQLKKQLEQLEFKYDDAVRNKDVLIARRKRAAAQQQLASAGAKLRVPDYGAELDRMDRRIREEEARAAATAEVAQSTIEKQFEDLEGDDELKGQLAALKAKVKGTGGTG